MSERRFPYWPEKVGPRESEVRRQKRIMDQLRVTLSAEMWCCGDELDGLCYQPQIVRRGPTDDLRSRTMETVWTGTFVNEPSSEELAGLEDELRGAAKVHNIDLVEEYGYFPRGSREIGLDNA